MDILLMVVQLSTGVELFYFSYGKFDCSRVQDHL